MADWNVVNGGACYYDNGHTEWENDQMDELERRKDIHSRRMDLREKLYDAADEINCGTDDDDPLSPFIHAYFSSIEDRISAHEDMAPRLNDEARLAGALTF